MASSCTMIIGGRRKTNQICFRNFDSAKVTDCIVIEKEKQFYPIEKIKEYFDDLIEMGFEFFYDIEDNGEIKVYVESVKNMGKARRMMLLMAIRYLWEGKYKQCGDEFFYIYETYTKIKNYKYMSKYSKLEIMCIAHNLAFHVARNNLNDPAWYAWNSNHCWSIPRKGKLLSKLPDKTIVNVNKYCTQEKTTLTESTRLNRKTVFEIIKQMK